MQREVIQMENNKVPYIYAESLVARQERETRRLWLAVVFSIAVTGLVTAYSFVNGTFNKTID